MAVNYGNTVCQVKAKVPAGQNPYRGFCDILQLKIPMYLCATNALRTHSNDEEDQSWVIRENTWPAGAEEPSVVYNAIPSNTLEFCRKYYERFQKFPPFDLFLYEASGNQTSKNSPDRGYLNANKFLSGELSTKYKVETHRIAAFGGALQQFLQSTDEYKNFTFQYGLDTSYKLILRSSFISVGGTPATLWFKNSDGNYTQNLQIFTGAITLDYKIGNDYMKLFEVTFDTDSEAGRVSSMKLTKISGPSYEDINVTSFEFKYKTKDQSVIKSIVACDELLLSTEPTMRHQVSDDADLWYLDSVSKNTVDVNVSFSFDDNGGILSTEASVCAYQHYIYEMDEDEKNGDDENGNSILNLVGDYVKYTVPSSSSTNGDDAGEDVRPITKPLFYLDEALKLPEFWNTTDETTL